MKRLQVLMLGWDFLPLAPAEPETNCFGIAQALANQVALTLILPKVTPHLDLPHAELIGLNNINLQAITPATSPVTPQPFAAATYERLAIPLYGSSVASPYETGTVQENKKPSSNTGKADLPALQQSRVMSTEEGENIFNQPDWDDLHLESKIIQYARFATRFTAGRVFDLIYAHNWLTFLAGNELKLITGKPLILQVNTLCQELAYPDNQGWMYELEKLAVQRSDYVFTSSREKAAILAESHQISPNKIKITAEARAFLNAAEYEENPEASPLPADLAFFARENTAHYHKTVDYILQTFGNHH